MKGGFDGVFGIHLYLRVAEKHWLTWGLHYENPVSCRYYKVVSVADLQAVCVRYSRHVHKPYVTPDILKLIRAH